MTQGKIELTIGALHFSGEGDDKWLSQELEKVFTNVSKLNLASAVEKRENVGSVEARDASADATFQDSLASHIKAKGGDTVQTARFLAAADWLRRKGTTEISTSSVTKALLDNHQKKLSNPAECLNQNVRKGNIEKRGKSFYITPDGLKELGYS